MFPRRGEVKVSRGGEQPARRFLPLRGEGRGEGKSGAHRFAHPSPAALRASTSPRRGEVKDDPLLLRDERCPPRMRGENTRGEMFPLSPPGEGRGGEVEACRFALPSTAALRASRRSSPSPRRGEGRGEGKSGAHCFHSPRPPRSARRSRIGSGILSPAGRGEAPSFEAIGKQRIALDRGDVGVDDGGRGCDHAGDV